MQHLLMMRALLHFAAGLLHVSGTGLKLKQRLFMAPMAADVDRGLAVDPKFVLATNITGRLPYSVATMSSKKKTSNTLDVCLVTQTSTDRLNSVRKLTQLWSGPISIAVLVRSDNESLVFQQFVQELHGREGSWNLHAVSPVGQFESAYDGAYPLNQLRNVALSRARSPYVFLTDVDFMPSHGLYAALSGNLPLKEGTCVVVPAFETLGPKDSAPPDMDELRHSMLAGKVMAFRAGNKTTGYWAYGGPYHRAENISRFLTATSPYEIQYERNFEPYVMAPRASSLYPLPQYDERFRGYGKDKIEQVFHMAMRGFRFVVLPREFITHMWHPRTKWVKSSWRQRKQTNYLWEKFQSEVASEVEVSGRPLPAWYEA
jgi:glycosyltransferase-like protein LARGE